MSPDRVFAAFAEPSPRQRWFRVPGKSNTAHYELDFRAGAGEISRNVFAPMDVEEALEHRLRFLDIVPDQRVVHVYEVRIDGQRAGSPW